MERKTDEEELARFREEWRAEVARRKEPPKSPETGPSKPLEHAVKRPTHRKDASGGERNIKPTHPAIQDGVLAISHAASPTLKNALGMYRQAVQREQKGELNDALALYRQAFRLDPNVDRAFHREEMLQAKLLDYKEKTKAAAAVVIPEVAAVAAKVDDKDMKQLAADLQDLTMTTLKDKATSHVPVSGNLSKITAGFPDHVEFEPEDERKPVHLNILPGELVYNVLRHLDVTSLERFARVSRRARLLALDPVYWSKLVARTYKPPQLLNVDDLVHVIAKYEADFRRVYIEQPRIRMDGIYIATCHYVRPGLSEDAWMTATHLVTYHRYLRFFPNGQVLSLLANEEFKPKDVISMLKPTLRMNGLYIGNWYLDGTTLNLVNLLDASGKYVLPDWEMLEVAIPANETQLRSSPSTPPNDFASSSTAATDSASTTSAAGSASTASATRGKPVTLTGGSSRAHTHGHSAPRATGNSNAPQAVQASSYIFDMTLAVRSRPLGRWNKLEIQTYDSIRLETGEVCPFPLKNERPFWFSKVRSYAQQS